MARWLAAQRIDDEWGPTWAAGVPLPNALGVLPPAPGSTHNAWCYGSPGVARALWHAGMALDDDGLRALAVNTMAAVYRRPSEERGIDVSPGRCHGVAGLLQITLRFAWDTGEPLFVDAAVGLTQRLLGLYRPEYLWGYRFAGDDLSLVDRAGLLDGAAGVALTLLAAGKEIVPCAGHMLNSRTGPPVVRFLDELTRDGNTVPTTFDWGTATGFPFLPRIQAGRVVLSPARWQVDPADIATPEASAAWRERWQPPRHVYLAMADHRLLLDLDAPAQVEQLRAEAGSRLVLHEALPAPKHAWLPGPDGHHLSELVVPVVLADTEPEPVVPQRMPVQMRHDRRLRPPGSDWLFAKLYHLATFEEDLLAGPIRDFCASAIADGSADSWFFMRYADPDPHLRIRWHGDPDVLVNRLAPRLLRWGSSLVAKGFCQRIALDTYDQEVERYGGPAAMTVAEELFAADSGAVLDLLRLIDDRAVEVDRTLLGMYTVDDLLAGLGLSEVDRQAQYRKSVVARRDTAEEYRARQAELRLVLGDPGWLQRQRGGAEIAAILGRRRASVEDAARRLELLDTLGELGKPTAELSRGFVHLHANRLLGCGHPPEQKVLGLLLRTRESLRRAPVGLSDTREETVA